MGNVIQLVMPLGRREGEPASVYYDRCGLPGDLIVGCYEAKLAGWTNLEIVTALGAICAELDALFEP
jgi:hypothetical protein